MHNSFGITVKEMLDLEIMKDAKVLAGEEGLGNKIMKMNVMEVPDIVDWVTTGEFLLTTAYSIKDDLESLKQILPQLKSRQLAGLGIKMKRYVKEIPEEIIVLANELEFPIIEVPFNVSYTDVMMPVLTQIINNQTNTLIKIDELHNNLMNVMLRGGGMKEITETLAKIINNTVVLKDTVFDSVIICCEEDQREEIEQILVNDKILSSDMIQHAYGEVMTITTEDMLKGKPVSRIHIPIYADDRHFGYLYVWEDHQSLSAVERTTIEAALPMIALDLIKKTSILEIESRHKIEFFDDLLSKDEKKQKRALDKSAFFDFDKGLGYAAMVITINNITGFIKDTLNNSNFLYQINGKILQNIERMARSRKEKLVFGNKSDQIILLFGTNGNLSPAEVKKEITQFSQEIFKYIERDMREVTCSIGIGRFYSQITDLWKSYGEATKAIMNKNNHKQNTMTHFDDLGILRVLSIDDMEDELIQFYQEMLQPLVQYDKEKDSDLVKTLQVYFQCGGNLKRISEEMFTHYNTVIYRVQRIKEITQIDLENANERLNLQVALKIYELIGQKKVSD